MKRVLCCALLVTAAFAVEAQAAPKLSDFVRTWDNEYGYGVGTSIPGQPLVGVHHSRMNGTTCVTISEMVPQCLPSLD